jgi:hypothetical protein
MVPSGGAVALTRCVSVMAQPRALILINAWVTAPGLISTTSAIARRGGRTENDPVREVAGAPAIAGAAWGRQIPFVDIPCRDHRP